jgi:hypothetical protein
LEIGILTSEQISLGLVISLHSRLVQIVKSKLSEVQVSVDEFEDGQPATVCQDHVFQSDELECGTMSVQHVSQVLRID